MKDETELAIARKQRDQTAGLELFDSVRPSVRTTDPETSRAAWRKIKPQSARAKLLLAHRDHPSGLTDYEAAQLAGLSLASEYATRCSELSVMGLLRTTTETRIAGAGAARVVRVITELGLTAAHQLSRAGG